jgi:Mn2+/Fe2+ NRAMP family transporter
MNDYRVYDARGVRGRARPAAPRQAATRSKPTREAIMLRGRRLKVATRRLAMLCFAAFAVLAGLRAGPTAASSHTAAVSGGHRLHHRHRHRHLATAGSGAGSTTTTATGGSGSSAGANLGTQQTSQPPVVQSSGS